MDDVVGLRVVALHYGKSPRQLKVQEVLNVDRLSFDCSTCKGTATVSRHVAGSPICC